MPDWVTRQYEPLGFPKRYNQPGLSQRERERRYIAKRRWLRKHDASFREAEQAKRREQKQAAKKACPTCGKLITRYSKRCPACHLMERARRGTKPERLWCELNTPYQGGQNAQHEENISRLNQLGKEYPL